MGLAPSAAAAASALLLLAASLHPAAAHPYPRDDLHAVGYSYLMARDCETYCGADNQYCCGSGEVCFTTNHIAGCSAANGQGNYVTTWTQTQTFTSTVATSWAVAPTPGAGTDADGDCIPANDDETSCGPICCADWQYCSYKGQCAARDDFIVPISTYTTDGRVTTRYSQAYRITGTSTGAGAGATAGSENGNGDGEDDGDGGGLSGGAIAGIVIGAIAAVALLILLCFCCIVRNLWAALCGGGRDKDSDRRNSRTVSEARYARRGGDSHSGYYGSSSAATSAAKKDKGENKFLLGLTAVASTMAALLFLNRGKKKDAKKYSEKSRSATTGTTTTTRGSRSHSRPQRSRSQYSHSRSYASSDSDRTESTDPSGYTRHSRAPPRAARYSHASRRPRDREF
jgi:hypothetical protein